MIKVAINSAISIVRIGTMFFSSVSVVKFSANIFKESEFICMGADSPFAQQSVSIFSRTKS